MGDVQLQMAEAQKYLDLITHEKGLIHYGTWYLRVKPDFNALR
jgi:hypothetical protein